MNCCPCIIGISGASTGAVSITILELSTGITDLLKSWDSRRPSSGSCGGKVGKPSAYMGGSNREKEEGISYCKIGRYKSASQVILSRPSLHSYPVYGNNIKREDE